MSGGGIHSHNKLDLIATIAYYLKNLHLYEYSIIYCAYKLNEADAAIAKTLNRSIPNTHINEFAIERDRKSIERNLSTIFKNIGIIQNDPIAI